MPDLAELIRHGSAHIWLFVPSAILLGALHGLEPGHSKTMMAAFIVAIRGTVTQAVLLGLSATASHTIVVWAIALGGMYLWRDIAPERFEPYFQIISAAIVIAIALWMAWRTWRDAHPAERGHHGSHSHGGHGSHSHGLARPRDDEATDAHARAHAAEIEARFSGQSAVTNWQIVSFGLTGGLIPCPAAITILLLCLQLRQIPLGAALVLCFSIGLALTLVGVGVGAALAVRHVSARLPWLSAIARRAPYLSSALIILVGLYLAYQGWAGLTFR